MQNLSGLRDMLTGKDMIIVAMLPQYNIQLCMFAMTLAAFMRTPVTRNSGDSVLPADDSRF